METTSTTSAYPFLEGGGQMGELTRSFDWSKTAVGPPNHWPQSLRTTVSIILRSRFPMFLWWGPERIQFYNDAYRSSLGNNGKHPTALGQPGEDCWPEIWPTIKPLIDQVMEGGEATWSEDQLIPNYRDGQLEDVYWTYSYSPVIEESGHINGVLVTCTETTHKVNLFNQLQLSEQRFQNLVREASVGIIVLSGQAMKVEIVNDAYARLIDRRAEELKGSFLFDIIPEADEAFRPIIDRVRQSGEPLYLYGQPYFICASGGKKEGFLNLVYQPYKELDGTISGVMVLCQDVTEQILANRAIEESEAKFRTLIEQAPVATCLFVGRQMRIEVANEMMISFFGKGPSIVGKPIRDVLTEPSEQPALQILDTVYNTGQPFEAKAAPANLIINGIAGTYYFDFSLKPLFNGAGELYAIMETAVDVTEQVTNQQALEASEARYRTLAIDLEHQVQTRTRQLELSVQNLSRSNQNLEQFAYIASHDLQEPLRKIQQFGDLLKDQYASDLRDGVMYLGRMQSAARRMSNLIHDLLSFSQISTQQQANAPVSLVQVIDAVLTDLELLIQETGAQVTVGPLPMIVGDSSQLSQLFQNLFSNALKFRKVDTAPKIEVLAQLVKADELPAGLRPTRAVDIYHCITVTDNGIGFKEEYLDRIFQIFQRLHGKNQFAGTGIGLAICERVAANHGGAITAQSQLGLGASFILYLPADADLSTNAYLPQAK